MKPINYRNSPTIINHPSIIPLKVLKEMLLAPIFRNSDPVDVKIVHIITTNIAQGFVSFIS